MMHYRFATAIALALAALIAGGARYGDRRQHRHDLVTPRFASH